MDKEMVNFQFENADGEPRLRMETSLRSQVSEIGGKEAEKLWGKIRDIADEFPQTPIIVGGLVGR